MHCLITELVKTDSRAKKSGNFSNGEYSGQNCLFMPHPQYPENVIFALFFAAFFPFFGAGGTNFAVQPNYNLKMARSAKNLGKFDLKCAKIGKNGQKITNFPIFWGEMTYQE